MQPASQGIPGTYTCVGKYTLLYMWLHVLRVCVDAFVLRALLLLLLCNAVAIDAVTVAACWMPPLAATY